MGLERRAWWRLGQRLNPRRAVIGAVIVAAALRLWSLTGLPLTICNDGVWYLAWAKQLLAGQPVDWHPARTPGYPLFLAAAFAICGLGPVAVLVAQHALGVLTAGLVAAMGTRLGGARWGFVVGLIAAADPVPLGMETYVMSEALATALLVLCGAVALLGRRGLWTGLALGAAIGGLCLVRPAFQIVAPFLAAGWLVTHAPRRWHFRAGAVAAGFLGVTGVWLVHNWRQGVVGMSSSNAAIVWVGVCEAGFLADDFPLPERVRTEYERSVKPAPDNDENVLQFVVWMDAWHSAESRNLMSRWVLHSIRSSPGAYAAMVAQAICWQLELFPGGKRYDEMRWLMWRISQDGRKLGQAQANINVSGKPGGLDVFAMPPGHGPVALYVRWWSNRRWVGWPRGTLFVTAVVAAGLAAHRRRWDVCLLFLGTLAYVGVHAAFLLAPSRYSLPCWVLWLVAPAAIWGFARPSRLTAPSPAPAAL